MRSAYVRGRAAFGGSAWLGRASGYFDAGFTDVFECDIMTGFCRTGDGEWPDYNQIGVETGFAEPERAVLNDWKLDFAAGAIRRIDTIPMELD